MRNARRLVLAAWFSAALLGLVVPAAAEEQPMVLTVFRVLVGKPEAVAAPTAQVLDFPGPFVVLGRSAEEEAKDVLQLMQTLKESYRLAEVRISGTSVTPMRANMETTVAVPGDGVKSTVTLLALDDSKALYGVSLAKEGEKPSYSKLVIARGERGVIGTRDGAQAPYLFLTIEPLPSSSKHDASPAVYPRLLTRVNPMYPDDAKKARIEGVVVLECTIDAQGVVRDLEPVGPSRWASQKRRSGRCPSGDTSRHRMRAPRRSPSP